jgi:hypothetical protein
VIEPSGSGQASVVFLGRRSFRMEVGTLMGTNELAIPMSASDVPTERIFGSDRARVFQAATELAETPRSAFTASKGVLIGLCLMAFTLGILLTSTVDRARPMPSPPPLARVQELSPALPSAEPIVVPVPPPAVAPVAVAPVAVAPAAVAPADPIVVAAATAAAELDAPAPRRAISRPARDARVRPAHAARTKHTGAAAEEATPEAAPAAEAAPDSPRPPAKKWVDPFAD